MEVNLNSVKEYTDVNWENGEVDYGYDQMIAARNMAMEDTSINFSTVRPTAPNEIADKTIRCMEASAAKKMEMVDDPKARWMAGQGKRVYVLIPEKQDPDLMYRLFDGVCTSVEELLVALKQ